MLRRHHSRTRTVGGALKVENREIGPELLERWALHYLGRYASSAENLRRVLLRRVRRRAPEAISATAGLIEALVSRYRESGLLDDAAYAAARVQSLHRRGEPVRAMRARRPAPSPVAAGSARFAAPPRTMRASWARLRGRGSAAVSPRRFSLAQIPRQLMRWLEGSPIDALFPGEGGSWNFRFIPAPGHASV